MMSSKIFRYPPSLLVALVMLAGSIFSVPGLSVAQPTPSAQPPADEVVAEPPLDWFHLDQSEDRIRGISSEKAYQTLLQGKSPRKTVTVAVIDSGIDIEHEDLKDNIWVNEDEIPDNGIDDDQNGYVDDVYGWNFIGGPDGRNIDQDTYELTREYTRLKALYEGVNPDTLSAESKEEYAYFQDVEAELNRKREEAEGQLTQIEAIESNLRIATRIVADYLDTDSLNWSGLDTLNTLQQNVAQARDYLLTLQQYGITPELLQEQKVYFEDQLKYDYNPEYDPRDIVGDDYDNVEERYYGNNDVVGPDPGHGTSVAGVIAAIRGNGLGIDGIANNVRIMVIRAVPDGDERDKDVANAIRYAVDNGADIINMSFGKAYSPAKGAVDAAVRYAAEKDVLLVHAAGNDGIDIDVDPNFPTKDYLDGAGRAPNWLEVGASGWGPGEYMVPWWSNYGDDEVDVFAPGVRIYTTSPGQEYRTTQGTSLAAPVVSGVAALLEAYYPELTAEQIRDVIIRSATRFPGEQVPLPGDEPGSAAPFSELSASGGIVNAYEALKLADEMVRQGLDSE